MGAPEVGPAARTDRGSPGWRHVSLCVRVSVPLDVPRVCTRVPESAAVKMQSSVCAQCCGLAATPPSAAAPPAPAQSPPPPPTGCGAAASAPRLQKEQLLQRAALPLRSPCAPPAPPALPRLPRLPQLPLRLGSGLPCSPSSPRSPAGIPAALPVLRLLGSHPLQWPCTQGGGMESLFPAPFWEVLYGSHLQGNLSLLSPNHSLLPPTLLLNASHGAFLPLGLKVTIVGLYLAVCIGGLLGNCLVMYVILRHTKMKTATNIYIFNLALADTLVLLTLPFQGTDVLLGFWPFGNALCKTVIAIDYYNMFTSTFTLTAMSVDRYVAICHPIRALDVRTSSKAQAVNVAIWALASVVGVPVAIMGSAQVEDEEIECLVEIPMPQDYWGPVFAICIFLFSFIIPVLIISVCYSLMIRRLRGVRLLSGSREKDRNLRRITRLVLVVVAVFVGCWTPVQVFVLVQGLGVQPGSETAVAVLRFCTALGYVNSCLNPILYAFLDENFKACFRKFCCAPALRREMQVSDRVRSIAKDVALACKTSETVPRPA
ncbi:nociceptin receptor isoform X2 [Canis lupus familiaris]|uniref:nociceptin receptor isoform X2 n=1 Tax=Canis lupus familiaris TaxID=9615 RepID=UPI0018F7DB6F|nr:nociceptin receptor isoform X2 [Canis lupus familiaris]